MIQMPSWCLENFLNMVKLEKDTGLVTNSCSDRKGLQIDEIKYSSSNGWKHVWIFDHSSCHVAMPHDALDVS